MKIGVFTNKNKDSAGDIEEQVFSLAESRGIIAERFESVKHYDCAVVIGGDGTILRVASDCAASGTPMLGVNKGTVGFLTEIEPCEIAEAFDKLLVRDYMLERRAMLDAVIRNRHYYALNDVVMAKSGVGRAITVEVRIGDVVIDRFKCDGYIVGTPTGSTAYSLSAGGAVISPNIPAIALTPINAHSMRTRSIVVGSFEQVTLVCNDRDGAAVAIDGEHSTDVECGENVTVTGSETSALFIRFGKKNFYARMLDKLGVRGD